MAHLKKNIYIKTMQFYRMSRYQKNKIKIKSSMTTSNYKLDLTRTICVTSSYSNILRLVYLIVQ